MGMYEVPVSMYFLGFGWRHFSSIFAITDRGDLLNMLVRNASPRVSMCFRFLVFSLSGPSELFECLLDLICGECNVISLYFVGLLIDLYVLCV